MSAFRNASGLFHSFFYPVDPPKDETDSVCDGDQEGDHDDCALNAVKEKTVPVISGGDHAVFRVANGLGNIINSINQHGNNPCESVTESKPGSPFIAEKHDDCQNRIHEMKKEIASFIHPEQTVFLQSARSEIEDGYKNGQCDADGSDVFQKNACA